MTTFEQLQSLIATTLKVPAKKISETTVNEDIAAWDSLGQVNLMMAVEQTFGVFLEPEEFSSLVSVPAIMQYLREHGVT